MLVFIQFYFRFCIQRIQKKSDLYHPPGRSKAKVTKVPCLCSFWPLFYDFLVSSTTVSTWHDTSDWCQALRPSCQNGNKSTASENAHSQLQPDAISLMFRSLLSSSICASVYLLFRIKITSARGIRTVMVLYYLRRSFHKSSTSVYLFKFIIPSISRPP